MILLVLGLLFYFFQLMDHTRNQAIGRLSEQVKITSEEIEREVTRVEYIAETLAILYFQKAIHQDEAIAHSQLLDNLELHMASGHFNILSANIRTSDGHLTTLSFGKTGHFTVESEKEPFDGVFFPDQTQWEFQEDLATFYQPLRGQKKHSGVLELTFSTQLIMTGFNDITHNYLNGRTWWLDYRGNPGQGTFPPSGGMDDELCQILTKMNENLESGVIETNCPFHNDHKAFTAISHVFIGDFELAVLKSINANAITGPQIRLGIILSILFSGLLILALLVLKLNIDQRKTALQKLAEEKAVIEGMFHSIDDLIFQQDLLGVYTDCNQSFANFVGLTPMEIRGRNDKQIGIPDDQKPISDDDREILKTARRLGSEVWVEGPDGQQELVDLHKHPLQHHDGEVYGIIGIGRVKTSQWRSEQSMLELKNDLQEANANMEEALNRAHEYSKETESANKAKSEFLANMSHEIRTPLGAVIGLTDLLAETDCSAKQLGYLNKMDNSAHSLLGIINDILDFSKIEAGKMTYEIIPFHLGEVVSQVSEMFSERVMSRNLSFTQKREQIPELLLGDPVRLRQILVNLLGNALKFTEKGGLSLTITGGTRLGEKIFLIFSIQDTGIGIPAENLSGLFSSFAQADTSTTRQFGGTGLGLSISQQLVELMGGNIWVESEVGKGTTFHFSLPFEEMSETAADEFMDDLYNRTNHISTNPGKPLEGLNILLVDDNEINREVISEILVQRGAMVDLAEDGQKATTKVADTQFHLVLMDMQMPIMDGPTATRTIRETHSAEDLPVMALTANAQAEDKRICLDAGMNGYMSKPVDPALLVDKILALAKNQVRLETTTPVAEIKAPETHKKMPGINLTEVMNRLNNNETLFLKLVKMFISKHENDLAQIDQALHEKDIPQAIHLSHALKGTAANLSAHSVQAAASDLESILRKGDDLPSASPGELVMALDEILSTMKLILHTSEDAQPEKMKSANPVDRKQVLQSLNNLHLMMEENDATTEDQFQTHRPDLENFINASTLDALEQALLIFDFEEALSLTKGQIEALNAQLVKG